MNFLTLTTPDGPFTILGDAHGVLASGWTDDVAYLTALINPALISPTPADQAPDDAAATARLLEAAGAAVTAYYAGDLAAPGRLPVRQAGGPFIEQAWGALRRVEPGRPVTYRGLAVLAGRPGAVRAAASACSTNAAALFVPCHRVLRSDGTVGQFRYGPTIKESLLRREGREGTELP
ncbi:MAG: MGMT family protein [Promicromonosporaceae bacterium]|nr:MGMT family protein [Promicromonosporaceae bacterium]